MLAGLLLISPALCLGDEPSSVDPPPAISPLDRVVSLTARDMPLKAVLAEVCRQAQIELDLDTEAIEVFRLTVNTPVTIEFQDVRLAEGLRRIVLVVADGLLFSTPLHGKMYVGGSAGYQHRIRERLPEWLRPLYGDGKLLVNVDENDEVISATIGDITDELVEQFSSLPRLRAIDLSGAGPLSDRGLRALAEFPALEKVSWHGLGVPKPPGQVRVRGNTVLGVLARMPKLRELRVSDAGITDAGVVALESAPELTTVLLNGNLLTDAGVESLSKIRNLRSLSIATRRLAGTRSPTRGCAGCGFASSTSSRNCT